MAKAQQDFTKVMQDMLGAFPVDTKAVQDSFKSQAQLGEKLSKVALNAAEKSADISAKWTKDTITRLGEVSAVKEEPTDYSKSITDFASAYAEMAAENMAAFAEVAKKVQMDTVELIMASGKEFGDEATAAVKKATDEVTKAAKAASK